MAVPRSRSSNARKNSRSAHSALKPKNTFKCSNCSKMILAHRLCPFCGFYKNKAIEVTVATGSEKKD